MTDSLAPPADVVPISLPTPYAIGRVNAYLLRGDPVTLVDPGPRMHDARAALEDGLARERLRPEDVELVLPTHQHHDHVGLAGELRTRPGAEVAALGPLARFLAEFERSMDMDDRYAVATMIRHGVDTDTAESLRNVSRGFRRFSQGVDVDRVLSDGDRIEAGGRTLMVLARPGHSPTDTVFYDESDGILIGGDHLLEDVPSSPVVHCPIGVDHPEAAARSPDRRRPLLEYLESMRRTSELDVSRVLPGHGEPFRDHRGLIDRRRRMHTRRARRLLPAVERRTTVARLAEQRWDGIPAVKAHLVTSEVLGHLDLLEEDGLIRTVEEAGLIWFQRRR